MLKMIVPVVAGIGLVAFANAALAQGEGCLQQRTASSQTTPAPVTQAPVPTDADAGRS